MRCFERAERCLGWLSLTPGKVSVPFETWQRDNFQKLFSAHTFCGKAKQANNVCVNSQEVIDREESH